jgi:plastocyanin
MKVRGLTGSTLLIAAVLALWMLATPPNSTAASTNVSIVNYTFSPATVTINVGDTVIWTNQDSVNHTTTSNTRIWDSHNLGKSATFQFTFNQAGTFPYFCDRHEYMTGTVIVQVLMPVGVGVPGTQ